MNPAPLGTRIRVTGNSNSHHYRVGGIYHVCEVDDDGTFKAADEHGTSRDYLNWSDCEPAGLGWEWLRTQLDARSLDLLSAFDGVEQLTLRRDVESLLVAGIPALEEAILGALPAIEDRVARIAAQHASRQGDDDEDDLDALFGTP